MYHSTNYSLPISEFDDSEGPNGWDVQYQACMEMIDAQMKTNNNLASGASTTLTTFRQGYTTVGAAVTALVPDNSKNSGSASYTPTSAYTVPASYDTLNGSSISFTASGNSSLAVYEISIPVQAPSNQHSFLHLYLDRSGTMIGQKRCIHIFQAYADTKTLVWRIPSPQSGTYSVKIRYYATAYGAWLGQANFQDGNSGTFYIPIESVIYEV